jgi:4-carboxymuconolactone decarboxylase
MRISIYSAFLITTMVAAPVVGQDRMPPLTAEQMTEAQRQAVDAMPEGTRRGSGVNPAYVALLRSPELMVRMQQTAEYLLRLSDAVDRRMFEFVILLAARQWTQQIVWRSHYPVALKLGIKSDTVQAIAEGRRPASMAEDEATAYDFFDELFRTRGVSDATYGRAVDTFGERGVIDMLGIVQFYTLLSMMMNVARTPVPAVLAEREPLKPLPR